MKEHTVNWNRAVILLSGGLDSATVVAMAKADGSCYTMSFDYGQRHRAELQAAERVAKDLGVVEHKVIGLNLNGHRRLGTDRQQHRCAGAETQAKASR